MKEKDNRPVYLNLLAIDLPIIGISSILHRVSGFALFLIFIIAVWMLDRSLSSEEEFLNLLEDLNSLVLLKVIFYLFLVGIVYHSLIGVKNYESGLINIFFFDLIFQFYYEKINNLFDQILSDANLEEILWSNIITSTNTIYDETALKLDFSSTYYWTIATLSDDGSILSIAPTEFTSSISTKSFSKPSTILLLP